MALTDPPSPANDSEGPTAAAGSALFADLLFGLRGAGVKVGMGEWIALMSVLSDGHVAPSLKDFYHVARALLIKHEAHYDTWDEVFAAVFAEGEMPVKAAEDLLEWLADMPPERTFSDEELAALERLPLEELRRRYEERLKEQKEKHDGGNHWIGTRGTSPFGSGGKNPAGIRVAGSGGGRSAIQMATARQYAEYRSDRVLDTRSITVALKKLRRLSRHEGEPELQIDGTIERTSKNGGFLELDFQPPRKNQARVLLMMDVGGSMTPYTRVVERLFSAASTLHQWKKFEPYYFHNCIYSRLFEKLRQSETVPTAEILAEREKDTFLIIVGDAAMAPSELLSPGGAIDWFEKSQTAGLEWLHRLRVKFERSVWLNPMSPNHWRGYTTQVIGQLFPMFPMTMSGLDEAVERLLRRRPAPAPTLDRSLMREIW